MKMLTVHVGSGKPFNLDSIVLLSCYALYVVASLDSLLHSKTNASTMYNILKYRQPPLHVWCMAFADC